MDNKSKLKALYPLLFVIMLLGGVVIGANLFRADSASAVINIPGLKSSNNKLTQIINYIEDEYVDTIKKNELINSTIDHLLEQLDPHSFYIPAEELARVQEPLEGNFDGIGVEFRIQEDTIVVVNAIPGGPSESLGIMAGDRIVAVNDSNVAGVGITNSDVIRLLRGEKGSKVRVSIKRKKEQIPFTITRGEIPIFSVTANFLMDDKVGYIRVNRFARTTYDEFMEAVKELQQKGMEQLVLDLRGNGGGLLTTAIAMCEEFLKKNQLIVYTEGKSQPRESYYTKRNGSLSDIPLAVLIDEGSASASEILAGAVQDNDRGIIVGRRSFGKGLVQNQIPLADRSALRLTVARYYTPTGRCIQRPYGEDVNYNDDYQARYDRGELQEKDSIPIVDSLKFVTPKGKIVYGGGGIVPDEFVGLDTTGASWYYSELNYSGAIFQFAFNYVDENRTAFSQYDNVNAFMQGFNPGKKELAALNAFAREQGVNYEAKEFEKSRDRIRERLKALIARNLFSENGYYQVIVPYDNTVQKALEVLKRNTESLG